MDLDSEVMAFTVGNDKVSNLFKTNINVPPKGVAPKEWINTLCDLLTESFQASFGVHKILLETLDEIYEGWGVYEGGKHYPNWQHVKKMLENKAKDSKGRETGWYESAMRIASVLTFGSFGKVVSYDGKKSLSVEDLFDKKVIFELSSLSNIEKKFFSEYILTYIYKLKKAQESPVETNFDYAILVDEAHNVFLKNKTNFISQLKDLFLLTRLPIIVIQELSSIFFPLASLRYPPRSSFLYSSSYFHPQPSRPASM